MRELSGILLTHYIEQNLTLISQALLSHLKACSLQMLTSERQRVRTRGSIIISAILKAGNLSVWPDLVPTLARALETEGAPAAAVDGVLTAVSIICDDQRAVLDEVEFGRPLMVLLPVLLRYFGSPAEGQRYLALKAVQEFFVDFPGALAAQEKAVIAGLVALAKDPSARVRQLVCRAFVTLSELHVDVVLYSMADIVEYAMASMRDSDPLVALEAADLWQAIADQDLCRPFLQAALPRLVPLLLEKMVYSEDDIRAIEEEEREQAARPTHLSSSSLSSNIGDDDDDDDDDNDDQYGVEEWNIRKASAAALDALAMGLGDEILPHLLPLLDKAAAAVGSDGGNNSNGNGNNSGNGGNGGVPGWAEQEALVLAIGAVSEGCMTGMAQYLPNVVPFLMAKAQDPHTPVRAIAFWALGRYSEWVIKSARDRFFCPAVELCANGLLDSAAKAREAACSALATYEENAGAALVPYMLPILQALMRVYTAAAASPRATCFYDPIGTLVDAVGDAFRCDQCAALVLPPFMQKLQAIDTEDPHMVPLLECLTTVAAALGLGIQPYAQRLYITALQILREAITATATSGDSAVDVSAASTATCDLLICGLDLVGALVEALGQAVDTLLARESPVSCLIECCKMHSPDVRQSAFALVGDLATHCMEALQPKLHEVLPCLVRGIKTAYPRVYNNATWALGEIALRAPAAVQSVLGDVLPVFVDLLRTPKKARGTDTRMLYLNTVAALGRIALAFSAALAPHLGTFVAGWCSFMHDIPDAKEKEDTFAGLYALIKANPQASLPALPNILAAIAAADFSQSNPQLKAHLLELLTGYKTFVGPANWQQICAALPQDVRNGLSKNYNFA